MTQDLSLRLFTVGQLKAWLYDSVVADGLSEALIARQRALAIVRSPYADDSMEVVSALFVGGELAAFTACYPDKPERPGLGVVFWYSTLYCKPEFRGRGYGMIVLGQLAEAHPDRMFDVAAVPETNESLQYLGFTISWFKQYRLVLHKRIAGKSFLSSLARIKEGLSFGFRRCRIERVRKSLLGENYRVEYVTNVDEETYGFIRSHSSKDLFLRSRESFDWMLSSPFCIPAELQLKLIDQNVFPSQLSEFSWRCVKIMCAGAIAGVYFLRFAGDGMAVKYIYYDDSGRAEVFNSVLLHLLMSGKNELICNDKALVDHFSSYSIHSKIIEFDTSFSCPGSFSYDESLSIQAGDGDMLT